MPPFEVTQEILTARYGEPIAQQLIKEIKKANRRAILSHVSDDAFLDKAPKPEHEEAVA